MDVNSFMNNNIRRVKLWYKYENKFSTDINVLNRR